MMKGYFLTSAWVLLFTTTSVWAAPSTALRPATLSSTTTATASTSSSKPTITTIQKKNYKVVLTNEDLLNLRSAPNGNARIVATIPANSTGVVGLGKQSQSGQSTWVQVKWAGLQGWVNRKYLVVDTNKGNAPSTKPATNKDALLRCSGTEPFWSIQINQHSMKIDLLDGTKYSAPVSFRQRSSNNTSIAVVAGTRNNATTTAFMQKVEACSDGMSDKNYPYSITAVLRNQKVVSGCCALELAH